MKTNYCSDHLLAVREKLLEMLNAIDNSLPIVSSEYGKDLKGEAGRPETVTLFVRLEVVDSGEKK